jgi:hypothetical protein
MKCAVVKMGGVTAIVCGSPRKPKKCSECGKAPGTRLCDWKMGGGKTCDKPLCDVCAFPPAHKKDLCAEHALAFKQWQAAKAGKAK